MEDKTAIVPVSDALADRLRMVLTAELVTFLLVPLFATLMSRGVLLSEFASVPPSVMMSGAALPTVVASTIAVRAALDDKRLK